MLHRSYPSNGFCKAHGHPCAQCHATWVSKLRHTTRAFTHFLLAKTPVSGMKPTCVNILSFLIPIAHKSHDTRATQHMQRMLHRRGRPTSAPKSTPHPGEAIGLIGARTHGGHIITAGKYTTMNGNPHRITRWGTAQTNGRGVLGTREDPAGPRGPAAGPSRIPKPNKKGDTEHLSIGNPIL